MSLESLGWTPFFEKQRQELNQPDWIVARVVNEERNLYRLETGSEDYWGEVSGQFRYAAKRRIEYPAVGDFVACVPQSGVDRAIIHHLFKRSSCLKRKMISNENEEQVLASNVETVFITTSANSDLNARRIERYLTLAWNSGAKPVILLTKADLAEDLEESLKLLRTVSQGAAIHPISTLDETGLEVMSQYFTGNKTAVLLGSSGVGKTTLVNYLLGYDALDTQEIRESDERGRHTTTSRDLIHLPDGGMLIDTPGMKEMGLLDQEDAVGELFEDVEALILQCKFSNCEHETETGCRIKSAIESGELDKGRMENYYKLQREIQFQKNKLDRNAANLAKKGIRKISRSPRASKGKKGR